MGNLYGILDGFGDILWPPRNIFYVFDIDHQSGERILLIFPTVV